MKTLTTLFWTVFFWIGTALSAWASYGDGSGGAPEQAQPGQGFGLVRAMIMLIFLIVIFRFFKRRGGPVDRPGSDMHRNPDDEQDDMTPRKAADRYTRAQQAWDMLSSDPVNTGPSGRPQAVPEDAPEGFDPDDFLDGAKAVYARLRKSCDERNYDDIRQFTTMTGFDAMKQRADSTPSGSVTHIMLLEADADDIRNENGRMSAVVHYQATLADRNGGQRQVRETWIFVKDAGNPQEMWKLDGAVMAS